MGKLRAKGYSNLRFCRHGNQVQLWNQASNGVAHIQDRLVLRPFHNQGYIFIQEDNLVGPVLFLLAGGCGRKLLAGYNRLLFISIRVGDPVGADIIVQHPVGHGDVASDILNGVQSLNQID